MTSPLIIGLVLVVGPVILMACIGIGLFGYSPEKAEDIRAAEDEHTAVVVEEVRHLHISRPDRFKRDRIDRHPAYVFLHASTWGYAISVFSGAPLTSNVAVLSAGAKLTMASCFLVGATLVLTGALMGTRIWRWRVVGSVHDNVASPRLGDDVRLPYTFGLGGVFAISISMGLYAWTSFQSTLGSLGGWITAGSALMCTVMAPWFFTRIRTYNRAVRSVVSEAVASLRQRGGHAGH